MKPSCVPAAILAILAILAGPALALDEADPRLLAELASIRAIDNHCHDDAADPRRGGSWQPDSPLGKPDYPDVAPLRRDNVEWMQAWKVLYGYEHRDMQPAHLRELLATKQRLLRESGGRRQSH